MAETESFGASVAPRLRRGQVIGLQGDLGAGKTAFVRGLARGLGCTDRVHSPTFALLNEYGGGRLRIFHIDLYRLNSADDVRQAGLEEYLIAPDGVSVVEWMERWTGDGRTDWVARGVGWLRFEIIDENTRAITYDLAGA